MESKDTAKNLNYQILGHFEMKESLKRLRKYLIAKFLQEVYEIVKSTNKMCYLVPYQFPFIFRADWTILRDKTQLEDLHSVFKQLNTFRRIQIVRSLIPKKVIFPSITKVAQVEKSDSEKCQLVMTFLHPLTSSEINRLVFDFEATQQENLLVSSLDLVAKSYQLPERNLGLPSNCNIIELKVSTKSKQKTQKCILYFREVKTIKKSDLFYCFIKMNSNMTIKLYFIPTPNIQRNDEFGRMSSFFLTIAKIQVSMGLKDPEADTLQLYSDSYYSTVARFKSHASENNYRYNMLGNENEDYPEYEGDSLQVTGGLTHSWALPPSSTLQKGVFLKKNTREARRGTYLISLSGTEHYGKNDDLKLSKIQLSDTRHLGLEKIQIPQTNIVWEEKSEDGIGSDVIDFEEINSKKTDKFTVFQHRNSLSSKNPNPNGSKPNKKIEASIESDINERRSIYSINRIFTRNNIRSPRRKKLPESENSPKSYYFFSPKFRNTDRILPFHTIFGRRLRRLDHPISKLAIRNQTHPRELDSREKRDPEGGLVEDVNKKDEEGKCKLVTFPSEKLKF